MSAQVRRDGVWEIRTWDEHPEAEHRRLTKCPLCGQKFEWHSDRPKHFFDEHGPEDAGLSPLSDDHDGQSSLGRFGSDTE